MPAKELAGAARAALDRWARRTGADTSAVLSIFDALTQESLAGWGPCAGGFSGICNDGGALQFCVALGERAASVRYLTEIGEPGSSMAERIRLSDLRLRSILDSAGYDDGPRLLDALRPALPTEARRQDRLHGGMWAGVAHFAGSAPAFLVYANVGWGGEFERWQRVTTCLGELAATDFARRLRVVAQEIVPHFAPAGLAIAISGEPPLIKLYLRPKTEPWQAGRHLLARAAEGGRDIAQRIEVALGPHRLSRLRPSSLLMSMAGTADAQNLDVKVDLCGHCVFTSERDARARVARLAGLLSLSTEPYVAAISSLEDGPSRVAHDFLGVGWEPGRGPRINVYVQPKLVPPRPSPRPPQASSSAVSSAVASAGAALASRATSRGWTDYWLPVGRSTSWATAYVAGCLAAAGPSATANPAVGASLGGARDFLLGTFRRGLGWGYNEAVETDADSTALALLFLACTGDLPCPPEDLLAPYLRPDGVATFRRSDPRDAWGRSHADVTPAALRALALSGAPPVGWRDVLARTCDPRGCWRSYWWLSDLYATSASLTLLRDWEGRDAARRSFEWLTELPLPVDAFDRSLLLTALLHTTARIPRAAHRLANDLLASRGDDGLWEGSAWLRVTRDDCAEPWERPFDSGNLYCDDGVLTSATAVRALSEFARRLP